MRPRPRREVSILHVLVVGLCATFMAYVHGEQHVASPITDSRAGALQTPLSRVSPDPPPEAAPLGVLQIGDDCHEIARDTFWSISENMTRLTHSARVVPEIRDGRPRGFRLYGLRPDGLWARLGLLNGDVLLSINGIEMTSPDKALLVYAHVRSAARLVVRIERQASSLDLCYRVGRDSE